MSNQLTHIAFIPDGNRRFAKKNNSLPWEGHRSGSETFKNVLEWCKDFGIRQITFWACSTENFKREKKEVDYLINLFDEYCDKFLDEFSKTKNQEKVKLSFYGDLSLLPVTLKEKMKKIMKLTDYENPDYKLNLLIGYGGHHELVETTKKIATKIKRGEITIDDIDDKMISDNLFLKEHPELVIRTGDNIRLSGFLSWQVAYSELMFLTDIFWPEFTKERLKKCIDDFYLIKRNFGK